MNPPMIFDGWEGLVRILIVGSAAYGGLVLMLRVSGKRTLSKMNAFDLVVTVALGSTLATILLDRHVPLLEGMCALALLIFLQYAITWLSVRSEKIQGIVKGEPTLLVNDGRYLDAALRAQRITREEVEAALRQQGIAGLDGVACVVLETDGSLSAVPRCGRS